MFSLFNLEGTPPGMGNGGLAQLGEHLLCKQGVNGSNPFISTNGPIAQLARACLLYTSTGWITNLYVMEVRKQIAVGTRQSVGQEGLFLSLIHI